jgi:hypothetical protein
MDALGKEVFYGPLTFVSFMQAPISFTLKFKRKIPGSGAGPGVIQKKMIAAFGVSNQESKYRQAS